MDAHVQREARVGCILLVRRQIPHINGVHDGYAIADWLREALRQPDVLGIYTSHNVDTRPCDDVREM